MIENDFYNEVESLFLLDLYISIPQLLQAHEVLSIKQLCKDEHQMRPFPRMGVVDQNLGPLRSCSM